VHTVLHLASMVDTSLKKNPRVWQINVTGTQNVIHACLSCCISNLVYTSSEDVCLSDVQVIDGDEEKTPYPSRLIHPYVSTKMAAEKMVLAANGLDSLNTIALRPVHIYGPGDPHAIVHSLRELSSGRVPFCLGSGAAQFELVYVDNVCHGHLLAASALADAHRCSSVAGHAFFLTEGHRMNYFDWLRPYAASKGVAVPTLRLPDKLTYAAALRIEDVWN
jgi:nucleoside-diphosphate-sugar epimerase